MIEYGFSPLPGLLDVFCDGRKRTTLLRLQSPAGYRLLPWLHLTLPPDLWNGRESELFVYLETTEKNVLTMLKVLSFCCVFLQSAVLMSEVVESTQHNWIIHGTSGIGVVICIVMVKH